MSTKGGYQIVDLSGYNVELGEGPPTNNFVNIKGLYDKIINNKVKLFTGLTINNRVYDDFFGINTDITKTSDTTTKVYHTHIMYNTTEGSTMSNITFICNDNTKIVDIQFNTI